MAVHLALSKLPLFGGGSLWGVGCKRSALSYFGPQARKNKQTGVREWPDAPAAFICNPPQLPGLLHPVPPLSHPLFHSPLCHTRLPLFAASQFLGTFTGQIQLIFHEFSSNKLRLKPMEGTITTVVGSNLWSRGQAYSHKGFKKKIKWENYKFGCGW